MKKVEEVKKRRANGEGSSWKYKDGRIGVAVYVDMADGTAKRVQASSKTEDSAWEKLKNKLKDMGCVIEEEKNVLMVIDEGSTVSEAITEFKKNCLLPRLREKHLDYGEFKTKRHLSSVGFDGYIWAFNRFAEHLGDKFIGEVTEGDLALLYSNLKSELSNESLRRIYVLTNKLFKRAVSKKYIQDNPYTASGEEFILPNSDIKTEPVKALSDSKIEAVLKAVKNDPYLYPVVYFDLHTGLRAEELCALKWGTILENGIVQVRNAISKEIIFDMDGNRTGRSKSVEGRLKTIPSRRDLEVDDKVIQVLSDYKHLVESKLGITLTEKDFVFRPEIKGGDHWTYGGLRSRLRRCLKKELGEDHGVAWHMFRHTCATILGESGAGLFELMQFLGDNQEKSVKQYITRTNIVASHNKTMIATRIAELS